MRGVQGNEGQDQFASYVAGVQEMSGEGGIKESKVVVDDWDSGPKEVVMFKEILDQCASPRSR